MKVRNSINLTRAQASIQAGASRGLRDSVEFLLTEANKHVPHDDGTLERSGDATTEGTRGAVSYDTPYAVVQHEDMSLNHDGKGEAKWLETTFGREAKTVGQIVATAIRSGARA